MKNLFASAFLSLLFLGVVSCKKVKVEESEVEIKEEAR